jgi:hypothetical protein
MKNISDIDIDLYDVHSLDRLTLMKSNATALVKSMKLAGAPYVKYNKRVGLGLVNLSIEVKRLIDRNITALLKKQLHVATDGRFSDLYCDVRIYPESEQPDAWLEEVDPEQQRLYVFVNFVVSIPKIDSLDSMARASVLSFFEENSWVVDKKINAARQRLKLWEKLNVNVVSELIDSAYFDDFPRDNFNGVNLEIDCDGVFEDNFSNTADHSRLVDYATRFDTALTEKSYAIEKITAKNSPKTVPFMIGGIAYQLGVKHISPKKLKRNDNLYGLMGFDDKLTLSLVQSIKVSVNVIGVVGGPAMFTVGDVIDFVSETLEYREEEDAFNEAFEQSDELNYSDGSSYKGDINNGMPHGKGLMSWADGSTYDGEWLNGVQHGFGKYTWANGTHYVGEWFEGRMHGTGALTYDTGEVEQGTFLAGEFVNPSERGSA